MLKAIRRKLIFKGYRQSQPKQFGVCIAAYFFMGRLEPLYSRMPGIGLIMLMKILNHFATFDRIFGLRIAGYGPEDVSDEGYGI
jgi:hypothetical protein